MLKRKIRKLLLYVSFSSIILRNQRNNQESISNDQTLYVDDILLSDIILIIGQNDQR